MDQNRKDPTLEMIEDCNNCHWMLAISEGDRHGTFCRRYPPQLVVMRNTFQQKVIGIKDQDSVLTMLPQTLPGGLACGEFKPAQKLKGVRQKLTANGPEPRYIGRPPEKVD